MRSPELTEWIGRLLIPTLTKRMPREQVEFVLHGILESAEIDPTCNEDVNDWQVKTVLESAVAVLHKLEQK